jgi:succinate-semialdehyde dehydrogenase / glutarate-semialdehyde dehydrogenase
MSASKQTLQTINPATGEEIASYPLMTIQEASTITKSVYDAFDRWKMLALSERADHLRSLAKVLRSKKTEYATMMTTEMGKPISQAISEVEKCAWGAEVYADNGEKWLQDEEISTDASLSYVSFEPLGTVLTIMPWNFPFWQCLRVAIPTLLAGNTLVLRHASACPGSALAIQEAFREAGFPENVFRSIICSHDVVSDLIVSPLIQGVSLTGSVSAGSSIGSLAASNLKKFVLELGGSDPYIVLDDANVEKAAIVGANARLQNNGQSCIAAKRFIIHEAIAEEFIERFVHEFESKTVGDPLDPRSDVGPLVSVGQVEEVDSQVQEAVERGAHVMTGGKPKKSAGSYFEPTVLYNVSLDMKVMAEEVFGPVAPIYVVKSESEAIAVGNDTEFGLGASIWTNNPSRARKMARQIESGMVFVNGMVKSDPRMPFGGVKKSGIGRELSKYGLKEFVNIKGLTFYDIDVRSTSI